MAAVVSVAAAAPVTAIAIPVANRLPIDPLRSNSILIDKSYIGEAHYEAVRDARKILQRNEDLQSIISVLGKDELSPEDRNIVDRAGKLQMFFTQPFYSSQNYTGMEGAYVPLEATVEGARQIISGAVDDIPEEHFYLKSTIESVREAWQQSETRSK